MYEAVKALLLDLLRAPNEPPQRPAGSYASVRIFRASPQFLYYRFLSAAIGLFLLAILFGFITIALAFRDPLIALAGASAMGLLWLLLGLAGYFLVRLEYEMRYYILTDRSLRIRKGVLNILEQTLTFANIQNVSIEQGPIQRLFGISSLLVDMAGGGAAAQQGSSGGDGHRAVMEGLEDAESIRDLILTYLRAIKPTSGLGGPEEREEESDGFGPGEIAALREILLEVKALRELSAAER